MVGEIVDESPCILLLLDAAAAAAAAAASFLWSSRLAPIPPNSPGWKWCRLRCTL